MAVATTELQEHLASIQACHEARTWAGDRTPQQAWDESPRADWLLWWAAKTETNSRQDVVRAACLCARRALRYIPPGELRPLRAIEAAERWADEPSPSNAAAAARTAAAAAWRRFGGVGCGVRRARRCGGGCGGDAAWRGAAGAAADAAADAAAARAACGGGAAAAAAWAAAECGCGGAAAAAARAAAHLDMCTEIRQVLRCPYLGRGE